MSSLVDQTEREKNREKPSTPVPFKAEELDETLLLSRPTKTPASSDRERLEREDIEPIPMESLEISDSKDEKDDNKQVMLRVFKLRVLLVSRPSFSSSASASSSSSSFSSSSSSSSSRW